MTHAVEPRQYLELPPNIRAGYEKRLMQCRRAWETTQDPLAVAEATTWTFHYHQPIEEWLEAAIVQVAIKARTPEQAKQHRANTNHIDRFTFMRDAMASGMKWDRAKDAVATKLDVDTETVSKSYKRIRIQLRDRDPDRFRYWTLKDVRYRDLG
jgi:hypothetical protein